MEGTNSKKVDKMEGKEKRRMDGKWEKGENEENVGRKGRAGKV